MELLMWWLLLKPDLIIFCSLHPSEQKEQRIKRRLGYSDGVKNYSKITNITQEDHMLTSFIHDCDYPMVRVYILD